MARINIEDDLFKDQRFFDLSIKAGGMQNALGILVWAFIVAQKHYLREDSDRLIPLIEWKRQSCSPFLIEVGFAEEREKGIYISGSESQFAWLLQRVEAGRKGGLSSRRINEGLTDEERSRREKARKAVANAVQRGRIIKPNVCEGCGKDGLMEAHHSDYDKPFEVNWVCKKCHHVIHDALSKTDEQDKRSVTSVKRDSSEPNPLISTLLYSTLTQNNTEENIVDESTSLPVETSPKKITQAPNVKSHELKWFMDLFNDNAESHGMAKIKALSDSRTKAIKKALKAIGDDLETWVRVFNVAGTKGFLKSNGDFWCPEFDYIFRNENYLKFSEADINKKIISGANDIHHLRNIAKNNPWRKNEQQ